MRLRQFIALGAAIIVATTGVAYAADDPPATGKVDGKLLLVLDSSGSMKDRTSGGGTKIEAARKALKQVVSELPDDAEVGMRVFGAKVFSKKDKGACSDTQNVVPVGTIDRSALAQEIDSYKPYGETPIGNALIGASNDLGREGKRTIVLLSDGEPTCKPDPCDVARNLRKSGVDLKVNVVGLSVSGRARSTLQCIANAGGGTYYDVSSPDELASSLVSVSVRALREFRLSGKPVVGGTSTTDPLALAPGRYTDTTQGKATSRYYTIAKPRNSDVTVSAVTRPPYENLSSARLEVELLTPDGQRCAADYISRPNVLRKESVLSAGTRYSPLLAGHRKECDTAKTLLARIGSDAPVGEPFELLISTHPQITNISSLPAEITRKEINAAEDNPFEPSGTPTPVLGGVTFSDAPALEPGRYRDSLRPGEQLIYKLPSGWGRRPRFRATLETDAQGAKELSSPGIVAEVTMVSPTLHSLGRTGANGGDFWKGERPVTLTGEGIELRARNIQSHSDDIRSVSTEGDQYAVLSMANPLGRDGSHFAAPVTISVDVEGQESGAPTFAESDEKSSEGNAASSDDNGGFSWLPIGIGLAAVVLVGAGFMLGRRRITSA